MASFLSAILLLISIVLVYWILGVVSRPVFKEIHEHLEKHHPIFFKKIHEEEQQFKKPFANFTLHHVLLSQQWKLPHDHKLRKMADWYHTLDRIRDIVTLTFLAGSAIFLIFS